MSTDVDSPERTTPRASPYRLSRDSAARTGTRGAVEGEIGLSAEFVSAVGAEAAGMMMADSKGMHNGTNRERNRSFTTAVVGTVSPTSICVDRGVMYGIGWGKCCN